MTRRDTVQEHVMPLADVKLGWWIRLRMGWAKLVPPDTVLAESDQAKLMVPRLPDLPGETLVTVAKRRPDGASRMLVALEPVT
jgi:hypothetical protein